MIAQPAQLPGARGKHRALPMWKKLQRYAPTMAKLMWGFARFKKLRKHPRVALGEEERRASAFLTQRVDHIVVLLMENRSFDSMLGFLSAQRGRDDVDGIRPGMSNSYDGRSYPAEPNRQPWLEKVQDPDHSGAAMATCINGGAMDGFVASYAKTLEARGVHDPDIGVIMRWFQAEHLPVYDHLAEHFCVCDRWFCSVPGSTWPNRLYAASGTSLGRRDNDSVPLYDCPSVMRELDRAKVSWRWYSFDPGSLRMTDGDYRLFHHENFANADKGSPIQTSHNLFDDLRNGALPSVSWIDPNFVDFNPFHGPPDSSDDHPPSDVRAGQELVWRVYEAIAASPAWERTLFVIAYDENGGFFDHVPPPSGDAVADERPEFRSLGPRVPAIVVSPYAKPRSSSTSLLGDDVHFDHTSIIKTILLRFCETQGQIPDKGARVTAARDLGALLADDLAHPAAPIPDRSRIIRDLAQWRGEAYVRWVSDDDPVGATQLTHTNEFSQGVLEASRLLRHAGGLPPGQT